MADKKKGNSLVWGIILIVFGVLFLLDQFNIDIWDSVCRFWPVMRAMEVLCASGSL